MEFGTTTIMMCLLFGTNALLCLLFQIIKYNSHVPILDESKKGGKDLSKPFVGTIECYTNLTLELFRTGLIMALTYICEKHWFFEHSTKSYSRDLFTFILILFFAYAIYTIKPVHDLSLLGREQTEEWKGWMQFIFLLYHYFHAEEVYNSVRVMITCYVWMTGFGNFSFFYIKQDFGWLRVMQMMWRLNFSVLLLMWTHGNTWILYYICPMHTFYFLMVYMTMYLFSSVNHSKWGIRWKLMVLGIIIFIVWDINGGIFDILFAWLGTESVVGAKLGSVWEYYFRTSLDHWSSFLGMIFAVNFPLAEQYFVRAKGWPLIIAGVLFAALTIWWLTQCYVLDKLEYNLTHSYYAIIPLTAYIFFRNITPYVRSGVSMSLHDLGKTTLETYLLQHHIWLTSNAKTLLTITPDHPWINFALATVLFFLVSKELYRITMSLRGMVIPDDQSVAFLNIVAMTIILASIYVTAYLLHAFECSMLELCLSCLALLLVCLLLMGRFSRAICDNFLYQLWSNRMVYTAVLLLFIGVLFQLLINASSPATSLSGLAPELSNSFQSVAYSGNSPLCIQSISKGSWTTTDCSTNKVKANSKIAFCETDQWVWDASASNCPVGPINSAKAKVIVKNKRIAFVGDSSIRAVYHQFIELVEPNYQQNRSNVLKHSDISYALTPDQNTTIDFYWSPMVNNVTAFYNRQISLGNAAADLIVIGVSYWDALYVHDIEKYKAELTKLANLMSSLSKSNMKNVWILPTTVHDNLLPTLDKQKFMTEKTIEEYRKAFVSSPANKAFSTVIETTSVSKSKSAESVDGIHYAEDVYHVIAQMVANGYSIHFPPVASNKAAKKYVPKPTGSMSMPYHGAIVLVLSFIMLFTMDSFFGIGFFSLLLVGKNLDWETAYTPLHNKIFAPPRATANAGALEMKQTNVQEQEETDMLLTRKPSESKEKV